MDCRLLNEKSRLFANADPYAVSDYVNQHVGSHCIRLPSSGRPVPWLFREQGREVERYTQGDYCCAQDVLACATLARSGAGLTQLMRFIVEEDLGAGRLQQVLQAHGGCSRPFSLIYPSGRHLPLRVRVFIDFLLQAVGR